MKLSENPVFRHDTGWSGRPSSRWFKLPVSCTVLGVLWLVFLVAVLAVSSGDSPDLLVPERLWGFFRGLYIVLEPMALFLVGVLIAYRRFSLDRRNRLFQDLYFAALDSREIVRGKWMALAIPLGGLLIFAVTSVVVGLLVFLLLGMTGIREAGIPRGTLSRGNWTLAFFWVPFRTVTGGAGLVSGLLGGMRLALIGRRGKWMPEILLQAAIWLATGCCGLFGLINLEGYQRVVREFWWHTVYLEQEADGRRDRL